MRRTQRIVLIAALVMVAPVLAGCADFDVDKLDVFGLNEKKKLPGERRAVFPEGVPGVTQGVPPEYLKENQPPPATAQAPAGQPPAAEPAKKTAAVEPEQKPKPKAKPRVTSRPTRLEMGQRPASQGQSTAQQQPQSPWPAQQQPAQQQPAQQQPAQQQPANSPWPAPEQNATPAPWPSAPPAGTFSR